MDERNVELLSSPIIDVSISGSPVIEVTIESVGPKGDKGDRGEPGPTGIVDYSDIYTKDEIDKKLELLSPPTIEAILSSPTIEVSLSSSPIIEISIDSTGPRGPKGDPGPPGPSCSLEELGLYTKEEIDAKIASLEQLVQDLLSTISEYESYSGPYSIDPSFSDTVLETTDKIMNDDVVLKKIGVNKTPNEGGGYTIYIG